jgi:hypothetical protein
MRGLFSLCTALLIVALSACNKEDRLRRSLAGGTGTVNLPSGEIELKAPLVIEGASNLTITGNAQKLRMNFEGDAAIIIRNSKDVRLENFVVEGNRERLNQRHGLPPSDQPMARWQKNNGVLILNSDNVRIERLTIRLIAGYAVLVSASKKVTLEEVLAGDSGSQNEIGRNNATGGILFEEGCAGFGVRRSKLRNIRGNGIWTHSLYGSPRNRNGEFAENDLRYIGRDALQAGHATQLRIVGNTGGFVGFPHEIVDVEQGGIPVAVDTSGNVDESLYGGNLFEEVNGKCIDLDGFHHGVVRGNACLNRRGAKDYPHGHYGIVMNNSNPDMESRGIQIEDNVTEGFRFGGLFLIGEGHTVRANRFRRLNLAQCNDNLAAGCLYKEGEPDLLRSGIYLAKGAHRPDPAKGNVIENNEVQGHGMKTWCVVTAPGVAANRNTVRGNRCAD